MPNEGTQLQQPQQATGPFPPYMRWVVVGLLALSAVIGMFCIGRPKTPPRTGALSSNGTTAAPAPGGDQRMQPSCDYDHEAAVITTPQGRFRCEVSPQGLHVWKALTTGDDLRDKGSATTTGTSGTTTAQPGQAPAQARRDAIADQRSQLLIKAAFNGGNESRVDQSAVPQQPPAPVAPLSQQPQPSIDPVKTPTQQTALDYDRNQPLYWLPEGTLLDAVLASDLDASMSGPVDAIVSIDKYYPGTQILLVPQGARVLGEVSRVSAFGQERVAVSFHRILVFPSVASGSVQPYSISLDGRTPGQDQTGANGLSGKVNTHFFSTFGAALAIGGISGLSSIGSYGGGYSPMSGFYVGMSSSVSTATEHVLDKYLNRPPTVKVPKGTRIKVVFISDLQFPAVPQGSL